MWPGRRNSTCRLRRPQLKAKNARKDRVFNRLSLRFYRVRRRLCTRDEGSIKSGPDDGISDPPARRARDEPPGRGSESYHCSSHPLAAHLSSPRSNSSSPRSKIGLQRAVCYRIEQARDDFFHDFDESGSGTSPFFLFGAGAGTSPSFSMQFLT